MGVDLITGRNFSATNIEPTSGEITAAKFEAFSGENFNSSAKNLERDGGSISVKISTAHNDARTV